MRQNRNKSISWRVTAREARLGREKSTRGERGEKREREGEGGKVAARGAAWTKSITTTFWFSPGSEYGE